MNITHHTSSSKANSFTIDNIVIDCGIPNHPCDILCITHAHGDHIGYKPYTALRGYLKQCQAVVCTVEVYHSIIEVLEKSCQYELINLLKQKHAIDGFAQDFHTNTHRITPYNVYHDIPCNAFVIEEKVTGAKYVHITDTVKVDIIDDMKNADYYSIEANYDETLLNSNTLNGRRHAYVQERIKDTGHLSNAMTRQIIGELWGDKTKKVAIIHVSKDNNHDLLLRNVFADKRFIIPKGEVKL
jgi:phosphoribosyl 1,2-cyclic phosphodiesterase